MSLYWSEFPSESPTANGRHWGVAAPIALVFIAIAAIKANEGVAYRYPCALRLIK